MSVHYFPRVLFVIDGLEFGGGERVFLQLASGMRDRFKFYAAAAPGGKYEEQHRELGSIFCPVDMSRRTSLKPILKLTKIIQNNKIDFVHSQGVRADFFARVACKMAGLKHNICTVAMPVEGFDVRYWKKMVYRTADRFTERFVERFIVVSDSLKKMLIEQRSIPEHKVVRIYNGIELDQYQPNAGCNNSRKEWNISPEVPMIGAIGRMVWQKGFEFLIKAMPRVVRDIPEAKLLLVGDGPLLKGLEDMAKGLKVDKNIIFVGYRSDIKKILSAIDILVVPSILEGFPMVTLEAMAMAKPIIATRINGITEQIKNGNNGILVSPKNHGALANEIINLIDDKEKRRALGFSARITVEQQFAVEKMVTETEKVYLSLTNTNQK